jgi:hypothetical protein
VWRAIVTPADIGRDLDQLSIAVREAILADANIVLQTGAYRLSPTGKHPLDDRVLVTSYPGHGPRRFGKHALELAQEYVEQMLFSRHRVSNAHRELHVGTIVHQSLIDKSARAMDLRQIENLDLGLTPKLCINVSRSRTRTGEFS